MWHLDSTVVAQQHNATELPNGNILVSRSIQPTLLVYSSEISDPDLCADL